MALIVALLALLLAGAIASAALATGRLRWRAGMAQRASARATLRVRASVERHLAHWPAVAESMSVGSTRQLHDIVTPVSRQFDSLQRLGARLFQLRAIAEETSPDGGLLARSAAAQLVVLVTIADSSGDPPDSINGMVGMAHLQSGSRVDDGKGSALVRSAAPGDSTEVERVPGGWWRVP